MSKALISRRRLLTQVLGGSAAGMMAANWGTGTAWGHHDATSLQKILVHVMLLGGADFRHLFAPVPGSAYANAYWRARSSLYRSPSYGSYAQAFADQYKEPTFDGGGFGIHKNAGWLRRQFNNGNVAIISNVYGSLNRDHDHSQLIAMAGDLEADRLDKDRDGWGGRLVEAVGGGANTVSLAGGVPIFCNGTTTGARLNNVVHANNTRDFALPRGSGDDLSQNRVLGRALRSYYLGEGPDAIAANDPSWPFARFFRHAMQIETFGASLEKRLANHIPERPADIASLYQGGLNDGYFGAQIANLYDCMFAADLLNLRVAHLDMGGWDTHDRQQEYIEGKFSDIFGNNAGLHSLYRQLDADFAGAANKLTFVFSSDFGRQLAANGANGTDHGRANFSIVVGRQVNGGVYGEMFPQAELNKDGTGITRMERGYFDIEGLTSLERVFGGLCDWVKAGTGDQVFPNRSASDLEFGVSMDFI